MQETPAEVQETLLKHIGIRLETQEMMLSQLQAMRRPIGTRAEGREMEPENIGTRAGSIRIRAKVLRLRSNDLLGVE